VITQVGDDSRRLGLDSQVGCEQGEMTVTENSDEAAYYWKITATGDVFEGRLVYQLSMYAREGNVCLETTLQTPRCASSSATEFSGNFNLVNRAVA